MTTQRATTEELPSCASPPPRAYPLTPTIPWLGGTAEYLDLLANISITLNDDDDDIIRDHAVDPALVCAADRQLLRVLMHAMRTEGAETCGFESGEDAKGGMLRFVNLGGDGGEEQEQGFVDVGLRQFLRWLKDAESEHGREEQEGYEGRGKGVAAPIPPATALCASSSSSPAREISLLSERSQLRGAGRGGLEHWRLLCRKLSEHSLSVTDVSKAQMDAWINTPQDIAEEYLQMHMLNDLKRKKIPRELEGEATQETVVPSGPSEEDAKEIHRNNAYMQLVGAKGTPADSSRARTLEEGTHIKPLQASAPEPKPKDGKRVKWTVCILVVLAIAFGLGFGLSRR
ncbi:hypothetical protein SLS55_004141 [Diplodia seriata]|uniref:Uncharacterized protein n=1 Tax=Diplodia seriata TaxID=420778 RepID=A0ABR3CLW4_9PEZI